LAPGNLWQFEETFAAAKFVVSFLDVSKAALFVDCVRLKL